MEGHRDGPGTFRPYRQATMSLSAPVIAQTSGGPSRFIGTPSIVASASGQLIAAHDLFGDETTQNETHVYTSDDGGTTWHHRASLVGQWWSSLFRWEDALYLHGVSGSYGDVVVRRSLDEGRTWTSLDGRGVIARGPYHCSATAVVAHDGRLWRAVERREDPEDREVLSSWLFSASVDADLLESGAWARGSARRAPEGLRWLEGNAVVAPSGEVETMLRVRPRFGPEEAALVDASGAVRRIVIPGGAKKFTVRYDAICGRYLAITNPAPPGGFPGERDLARIRNRLVLLSSSDLTTWEVEREVIASLDWRHDGFQYADWVRVGSRLAVVARTAYRRPTVPHLSAMASNLLTFHWVAAPRARGAAG